MATIPSQKYAEGNQAYIRRLASLGIETSGFEAGILDRPKEAQPDYQPNIITPPTAITSATLIPQTDRSKQITSPLPTPVYDISGLDVSTKDLFAKTQSESNAQQLANRIQAIQTQATQRPTEQFQQEALQGVPEKQTALRDLETQITALKNEAAAVPIQAAGVNVTASMLGAKQAEQQRQIAVRALTLNSLFETLRGNLLTAQAMADRAVEQKYAPLEAELKANIANYDLILKSPDATLSQQRRAEALRIADQQRTADIAMNKNALSDILDLTRNAVQGGFTDLVALNKAQNAVDVNGNPSVVQAQQILARAGAFVKPKVAETQNTLTLNEAKNLGLPTSLVGKSEAEVGRDLDSSIPPIWFKEMAESQLRQSLTPQKLQQLWNEFKTKFSEKQKATTSGATTSGATTTSEKTKLDLLLESL